MDRIINPDLVRTINERSGGGEGQLADRAVGGKMRYDLQRRPAVDKRGERRKKKEKKKRERRQREEGKAKEVG